MTQALNELSELIGILPEYHDIWGQHHETGDATRRAILGAMGLRVGTETEVEASLAAWRDAAWAQRLPPVCVTPAGQPIRLTLRLPTCETEQPVRWRIVQEDGGESNGECLLAQLPVLDAIEHEGVARQARQLELPALGATGYHRLEITGQGHSGSLPLIIHPEHCYQPEAVRDGRRVWGLAVQLYGLRSARDWGLGDYGDLRQLVDWAAQSGAALVGVNPLHALFPHNPRHCSPYSPSSRQYYNVLHLDVTGLPEYAECAEARAEVEGPAFQARLAALRAAPLIDYAAAGEAKQAILKRLYRHFRAHHLTHDTEHARAFRAFQAEGGEDLRRFALYHALQTHFYHQDGQCWGWPVWPAAYQDPDCPEVEAFAAANLRAIEWQQWLQWHAQRQLAAVGQRCFEHGLGIGLYQDLAVGVDKGGAETWMHRELYALDAKVGCPPDDFNPKGQDWGLPPWIPQRLRAAGYAPFIAMLRANMKYAGALRIDHVMALMRLYWVPNGLTGDQGAYVLYPFDDLLGILALESQRNACLIVGEDLGTVPDPVREALHRYGVLSYRLFYFERTHDGQFQPPGHYPEQALVAAATHDLPTLTGFWRGEDIALRTALDLYPSPELRAAQIAGRTVDRARLLEALAREGLLPDGLGTDPAAIPEMTPALIQAIHRYLARSPARIALIQAEDLLGEAEQANLPGTTDQHPNWRRRLHIALESWASRPDIVRLTEAMRQERG